jgi:hypothetical protein
MIHHAKIKDLLKIECRLIVIKLNRAMSGYFEPVSLPHAFILKGDKKRHKGAELLDRRFEFFC